MLYHNERPVRRSIKIMQWGLTCLFGLSVPFSVCVMVFGRPADMRLAAALFFFIYYSFLVYMSRRFTKRVVLDLARTEEGLVFYCLSTKHIFPATLNAYILEGFQSFVIMSDDEKRPTLYVPRRDLSGDENISKEELELATGLKTTGRVYWA